MKQLLTKGWPVSFEMSIVAPASREIVWGLITDWEHQGDWMLEASEFVVVSPEREGVGVEAEATVRVAGIRTRDRIRIVGWEPPKRLVMRHVGWVSGEGQLHLTPMGDDTCHVFWREELEPPWGGAGALGLTLLKPVMLRLFRRDLRILASLARVAQAGVTGPAAPRRKPRRAATTGKKPPAANQKKQSK